MIARRVANVHSLMRRRFWDSIPLPDLFDYSSRSGLNLVDALGGSNATILGGKVAYSDGTGKTITTSINLTDGDVMEFTALSLVDAKVLFDITGGYLHLNYTNLSVRIYALGTTVTKSFATARSATIPLRYRLTISGNNILLKRLDNNEELTFTFPSPVNITIINIFKFGTNYFTGYLCDISKNGTYLYYFNNNTYNSITGVAATNNGVTFPLITTVTPQSTTDALADGYFQLSGGEQVVKPQFTLPVGAVNHVGGQVHNLISSFVDFPTGSSMDRSNTTIFNATCRASIYYDSSNPRRWHVSELNYETMNSFLQESYRNTRFVSFKTNYSNQLYIDRIMGFTAPLTGSKLTYIQKLIGYIS